MLLHGSGSPCELLSTCGTRCQLLLSLTHLAHQVSVHTLHDSDWSD